MASAEQLNAALTGRYEIERQAGEGGMATVFVARDVRHNRRVALKVLKPELGVVLGPDRFLTEIEVTANLHHPNLLPLFDSGGAEGSLYYVMPYVEGETLRQLLDRERQLAVDEALRITTAIASALDYAHRHAIIHRDLKPENILMHEGQPLVMDFGIALAVSNAGGARITQTGLSLGTPQYMSPEQATGDRQLDARTDVYSLAAICYEMLVGDPPHVGSTVQAVIAKVLTDNPRSIRASRSSVPEHVEAAVFRGLAKLPADRFATAAQFAEALTGARPVTLPTSVAGVGVAEGVKRRARVTPRELVAWGIAASALASAAIMARPEAPPAAVPGQFAVALPDSVRVYTGGGNKLAFSRDGSQLVVVGERPGEARALYLRRIGDPLLERIRGTDSAANPAFSPDGDRVIFTVGQRVRMVPVVGGTPRTVVDSVSGAMAWGDGGRLAVVRTNAVMLGSIDGGPLRLLAGRDSARRILSFAWPHFLPGGEYLLATMRRGAGSVDSSRIVLIATRDGEVTDLDLPGVNPHYTASGHLVFGRPGGEVYAVPFSLSKRRITGAAVLLLQDVWQGTGGATGFAVAQNGSLAFHTSPGANADASLYSVDLRGGERLLSRSPARYSSPRVSPDGGRVAVTLNESITTSTRIAGDIWVQDLSSGALTRLTSDSASSRPEWSRDGNHVYYIHQPHGDTSRIRSRPLYRTGDVTTHATGSASGATALNAVDIGPRGGWSAIRIGDSGTNTDIWIAPTDSLSAMRPFVTKPSQEAMGRVSPDGSLLAYVSNETGRYEVYVTPVPGPGPHIQISIDGGSEPVWGRDTGTIFYRGPGLMMSATIAARPTLRLVRTDSLFADRYGRNSWHANYDIFPDGRRFVMARSGGIGPVSDAVFVIVNWPSLVSRTSAGVGAR